MGFSYLPIFAFPYFRVDVNVTLPSSGVNILTEIREILYKSVGEVARK